MNIFTYGVLQHNRILKPLTGSEFTMLPATLDGYRKIFFDYDDFAPCAIVRPDPTAIVWGQLVLDVDPSYLPAFDAFECVDQKLYQRIECRVTSGDGTEHAAWLYAAGTAATPYFGQDWDEDFFIRSGRLDYLENLLKGEFDPLSQQ
ncbi:MAG: gamma-glutamylcyclotransferase family protein [Pseudomonadota bacterium]